MVRHRVLVGLAVLLQQRKTPDRSGDAHVLRRKAIQQIGAQQYLVEQVPVVAKVLGALEVKGAARLAVVAEMVPHGIVKKLVALLLHQAGFAGRDAAAHHGVQAAGYDHARLERIHVHVAQQNGALMPFARLDLVDALRQVHRLNQQALLGEVHLGGKMSGGEQNAFVPRQRQAANRDAMALKQRRQQARLEAGEEKQVPAVAGSVLVVARVGVVGRVGVEFLQNLRRLRATLGEDDDVGILLSRQVADKAVQVATVQIPEEEPRHKPSVTEGGCGFELRKDNRQFRVSSFKFPVASSLAPFHSCHPERSEAQSKDLRVLSLTTDNWLLATDNCFRVPF